MYIYIYAYTCTYAYIYTHVHMHSKPYANTFFISYVKAVDDHFRAHRA